MSNIAINPSATPSIAVINGKLKTTSLNIANTFSKVHKNVIQRIESLDCSPDFMSANFSAHVKTVAMPNGGTRESKHYEITRDGFAFLCMGFTGARAAQFKEAYIAQFNAMEASLKQGESYLPSIMAIASAAALEIASKLASDLTNQVHNQGGQHRYTVVIDTHDKSVNVRRLTSDETLMKFTEMDDLLKPLMTFYRNREIGGYASRSRKKGAINVS